MLSRQCLSRRIADRDTLTAEAAAWANQRNEDPTPIHWHFTTDDARVKLRHLYPKTGA